MRKAESVLIKSVQFVFGEIENFLLAHGRQLSSKTFANVRSGLHDFFEWLVRREVVPKAPNCPDVWVKLSYRQIIGKESQQAIFDELSRITPFKDWLGIKWLYTYISIRPDVLF